MQMLWNILSHSGELSATWPDRAIPLKTLRFPGCDARHRSWYAACTAALQPEPAGRLRATAGPAEEMSNAVEP